MDFQKSVGQYVELFFANVVPRVRRHLSRQYRTEGRNVCRRCGLPDTFTALKMQWQEVEHDLLLSHCLKTLWNEHSSFPTNKFGDVWWKSNFKDYAHPWPWYSHINRKKSKGLNKEETRGFALIVWVSNSDPQTVFWALFFFCFLAPQSSVIDNKTQLKLKCTLQQQQQPSKASVPINELQPPRTHMHTHTHTDGIVSR